MCESISKEWESAVVMCDSSDSRWCGAWINSFENLTWETFQRHRDNELWAWALDRFECYFHCRKYEKMFPHSAGQKYFQIYFTWPKKDSHTLYLSLALTLCTLSCLTPSVHSHSHVSPSADSVDAQAASARRSACAGGALAVVTTARCNYGMRHTLGSQRWQQQSFSPGVSDCEWVCVWERKSRTVNVCNE